MFLSFIAGFLQEQPPVPLLRGSISNRTWRCAGSRGHATCSHEQRTAEMGLFTKDIKTMNDLFVHQLQDIYYAEKQLVKALPTMAQKAADRVTARRAKK